MSKECQRVIMLHAVTEIRKRLQEDNISIGCQPFMYAGGAWSLYISFQNHNTQADTGKFTTKLQ